ncbi:MAG: hypothetical protein R3F35_12725 [Myxococcota bacterium]
MLASGSAFAAATPIVLPPEGQYVVKWYQPDGVTPVANWEIELTPVGRAGGPSIVEARTMPEDACWSVDVPVGEQAGVRIRSVSGTEVSPWSPMAIVPRANGSYRLKWYQPQGASTIDDWDLEITPLRDANARFVASALVRNEHACWALDVPATEPSLARIRPIAGPSIAPWSAYTLVPEPGLGAASAIGVTGLAWLARRRRRGAIGGGYGRRRRASESATSPPAKSPTARAGSGTAS